MTNLTPEQLIDQLQEAGFKEFLEEDGMRHFQTHNGFYTLGLDPTWDEEDMAEFLEAEKPYLDVLLKAHRADKALALHKMLIPDAPCTCDEYGVAINCKDHAGSTNDNCDYCDHCERVWPCETVKILTGEE